ncbi:MAG: transcriptional repressor [Lachnospiraceae bacterium]|nr:transcriptional repressor [Lachnospiraceae bacterium]
MQKDMLIEKLRKQGCRITKQRLVLLDIILSEECSCCKEIYYKASKQDSRIGSATVYRMINTLEEIGAINRKNMYKVACSDKCMMQNACSIALDDGVIVELSAKEWHKVIRSGLIACGYVDDQKICNLVVKPCECLCS